MSARFDLRKSPIDGLIRKWELIRAVDIAGLDPRDYPEGEDVWIVTGVFKTRREVFDSQ